MSHLPKEKQPFVCCKCARRFYCEALLKNHERVHLPIEERLVFPCTVCQKMFCSKSAVSSHHKAIHLKERPFVCDQCGRNFASRGVLQDHLTTHSDDFPWTCAKCNKKFKTKYRLKLHLVTHEETLYQCPICHIMLSSRRTLRMHLVVHKDTKAYECPICGKAFRRAKDVKNHNKLHTGQKPYTCPFCSKTFANGSNCRSHKRRKHSEEMQKSDTSLSVNSANGTTGMITLSNSTSNNVKSDLNVSVTAESIASDSKGKYSERQSDFLRSSFTQPYLMDQVSPFYSPYQEQDFSTSAVPDFLGNHFLLHQSPFLFNQSVEPS